MSRRKSSSRVHTGKITAIDEEHQEASLIAEVQKVLRLRIQQTYVPEMLNAYEEERKSLFELIQRTVLCGESNSVLLVGPRASGKSTLISSVLEELSEDDDVRTNLLQIKLHGLLQTDDKIALKEITRQLQLENTVGDRVFGSFAEQLQFLLDALKSGDQGSKAILFVLEEFDLFAQHRNQTLLYNLFDISQSAQTPICVLGITCRLDVIELLEKRVKSRFSHRQIHLFCHMTFNDYVQKFREFLCLPETFIDRKYRSAWNAHIESISKETATLDVLRRQFHTNKEIGALQKLLIYPICCLNEEHQKLQISDFVDAIKLQTLDSKSAMLHGVSVLELCLIIAMKHLMDIYDGEAFNFEMVYNEYQKFAIRKSSMQVFHRAVVLKAFEHLMALEFIRPQDGIGAKVQKEYRPMTLLIHPSQVTEALQKYPNCPTDIKQWSQSSLVA